MCASWWLFGTTSSAAITCDKQQRRQVDCLTRAPPDPPALDLAMLLPRPHQPLLLRLLLVLVVVLLAAASAASGERAPRRALLARGSGVDSDGDEVLSRTAGGAPCYKGRPLPNLFLIGGQKCGSTTLWGYVVSDNFGKGEVLEYTKEIHFADQPLVPHTTPEWLAAYSKRYPPCSDSRLANRIGQHYSRHGLVAGLKFIVSLRDPVERTLSWFGHIGRVIQHIPCDVQFDDWAQQTLAEARTCMAARQDLPKPRVYEECRPSALLDSWYAVQLDPWWRLFPPQRQFLIVDFHELVYDREAIIARVLDYLGIEYELPLPDRVVHDNAMSDHSECAAYPAPTMSNETHAMLVEFFQPLNEQLKTLFEQYGVTEWMPEFLTRGDATETGRQNEHLVREKMQDDARHLDNEDLELEEEDDNDSDMYEDDGDP
eukprot:jgi/Chlat1/1525/Chrsp122S01817